MWTSLWMSWMVNLTWWTMWWIRLQPASTSLLLIERKWQLTCSQYSMNDCLIQYDRLFIAYWQKNHWYHCTSGKIPLYDDLKRFLYWRTSCLPSMKPKGELRRENMHVANCLFKPDDKRQLVYVYLDVPPWMSFLAVEQFVTESSVITVSDAATNRHDQPERFLCSIGSTTNVLQRPVSQPNELLLDLD